MMLYKTYKKKFQKNFLFLKKYFKIIIIFEILKNP